MRVPTPKGPRFPTHLYPLYTNEINEECKDQKSTVTISQVLHLTKDTVQDSQEASPSGSHKARLTVWQRQITKRSTKEVPPWNGQ